MSSCPTCGRPLPRAVKITGQIKATVVHLRYDRKTKQVDIAASLGISQASVARILSEHERNVLT